MVAKNSQRNIIQENLLLMASQKVWVADLEQGFVLGHIVDLRSNHVTIQTECSGNNSSKVSPTITVPYELVLPTQDNPTEDYDDNCSLMYLNEATLLYNVRLRYERKQIYTYIANMLIAINPYLAIDGLYSAETVKRYQGKSLGTLPPHVFAIGDKAFRDMKVTKQSQSIIVSGESGAGKTESTKYLLRYLCGSWGSTAGSIEQKILDANPVLESFGNAKTTRNNNSSRFGKFIEIHFEKTYKVAGGFISHYLLEKSRICTLSPNERSYHIFYQLLAGAPTHMKRNLGLEGLDLDCFHYIRQGCLKFFGGDRASTLYDPIVDDFKDFLNLEKALDRFGLSEDQRQAVYTVVAAVLHLGNIQFEDDPDDQRGGCRVTVGAENSLRIVSNLLGVDKNDLRQALTSRVMQAAKGGAKGTVIMVMLKVYEANSARDALAKAMYSRLFDYIVYRINQSIPFQHSVTYVGVLDIAGFEFFTVNSFEQFCINYCNEKLQQFFNERVLSDEQALYEKEGLGVDRIDYIDNSDCIDLIECPRLGILSILDEESKLPKPTAVHFTTEVHKAFPNHFRLALPRKSKIKQHREIRDEEGFLIRHFAGAVCYKTIQFIEKNNDALHASLEGLVQESTNTFLQKNLFALSARHHHESQPKGRLTYVSVASKFRSQLSELLEKLRGTGTSFVRCVKPNAKMIPWSFEGGQILSQLQSAGMTSVLELMQKGFPSRVRFSSLYSTYKDLLPPKLSSLDPRLFCRALFKALGLSEEDFRFGSTRVFFRPGKFKEFDQIMRNDSESLRQMVAAVARWIVQSKWKKIQFAALSVIKLRKKIEYRRSNLILIQKTVRMHLARTKHRPRYRGILNIRKLNVQIIAMSQTIAKLKTASPSCKELEALSRIVESTIHYIKENDKLKEDEIENLYKDLLIKCDLQLKTLTKRVEEERNAEEHEKARKIKEEMERQKKEKEEAMLLRHLDEENRRKKGEIEARRREEARQEALKVKDIKRCTGVEMCGGLTAAEEQERRDAELAYRLSQESNGTIIDSPENSLTQLGRSSYAVIPTNGKKYDLSGWKYSELRDTINTSCDVELLEACREEFHRRLKVYHAWKAKNRAKSGANVCEMSERAPKSIYQHMQSSSSASLSPTPLGVRTDFQNRYFRIPFTKDGQNKGLWYAHFEGPYITRQMELHAGRPAVLLIAGCDDMEMCELKLHETGLTRRRGAEVLEHEFEREWSKHGGKTYIPANQRKKTG